MPVVVLTVADAGAECTLHELCSTPLQSSQYPHAVLISCGLADTSRCRLQQTTCFTKPTMHICAGIVLLQLLSVQVREGDVTAAEGCSLATHRRMHGCCWASLRQRENASGCAWHTSGLDGSGCGVFGMSKYRLDLRSRRFALLRRAGGWRRGVKWHHLP
jgi:hypothetical protein